MGLLNTVVLNILIISERAELATNTQIVNIRSNIESKEQMQDKSNQNKYNPSNIICWLFFQIALRNRKKILI